MEDSIKVNGSTITWMVWEYTHGLTEGATWVNIKMTRNMDMVFTNGLTEDFISEVGCVVNNMV